VPDASPSPPSNRDETTFALVVLAVMAAVAAVVLFAVPLVAAAVAVRLLDRHTRKLEWAVLAAAGAVMSVVFASQVWVPHLRWMWGWADGQFFPVPWVAEAVLVFLFAGLAGLAFSSGPVRDYVDHKILHRPQVVGITPDERTRERLEAQKRSMDAPTVDAAAVSLAGADRQVPRSFPIGLGANGEVVRVSEDELKTHMLIIGATGAGKTESIKTLAGALLDANWNVLMIDLKEDTSVNGLRDFCRDYAIAHAQRYQEIALSSSNQEYWFNTLDGMSPDEAQDTINSLQSYDDGFWQAINRTMLGQLITLVYDAHAVDPVRFPAPNMYAIGQLLREPNLNRATKEMRAIVLSSLPHRVEADFSTLSQPSKAEAEAAIGLGNRIVQMYETEAGRRVLRPAPGRRPIDVTADGVVYIGLNSLGMPELAKVVSTSVLMRVAAYAGARTTGAASNTARRTALVVDEANFIARRQVKNLLSRARSAGIAVVLCTQSPGDWNDEEGRDWETITNNTNVSLLMRQNELHQAELLADLIGKETKSSLMSQVRDGVVLNSGSIREVIDYRVQPEQIRNLKVGQGYLRVGVPDSRVEYVTVFQRDPNRLVR
jgi:type IV secretory pathway TraG/TraD family ATPase VirD4